jgi:hypothetical protein
LCGARNDLSDQLDSFWLQITDKGTESRHVPAWVREARHGNQRVGNRHHDDRDGCGGALGRQDRWHSPQHDQINIQANEFRRQVREAPGTAGRAILDGDVLPLDVAEVP